MAKNEDKNKEIKERFDLYAQTQRDSLNQNSGTGEVSRIEAKIQTVKEVTEIVTGFSLENEPENNGAKVGE